MLYRQPGLGFDTNTRRFGRVPIQILERISQSRRGAKVIV